MLEALVQRISERVGGYLERQGWLVRDGEQSYAGEVPGHSPETAGERLIEYLLCQEHETKAKAA